MPDTWEIEYGLDPLSDDSNDDFDNDGVSNIEEYLQGRHPSNKEPITPDLIVPDNHGTGIILSPILETGKFNDIDGNEHYLSEWEISSSDTDFSSIVCLLVQTDWREIALWRYRLSR